ncbi:unnamed protein product [Urochloa humidicola]
MADGPKFSDFVGLFGAEAGGGLRGRRQCVEAAGAEGKNRGTHAWCGGSCAPWVSGSASTAPGWWTEYVLSEARAYADHAGRASLEADDMRLAIRAKSCFSPGPPRRELILVRYSDAQHQLFGCASNERGETLPLQAQKSKAWTL